MSKSQQEIEAEASALFSQLTTQFQRQGPAVMTLRIVDSQAAVSLKFGDRESSNFEKLAFFFMAMGAAGDVPPVIAGDIEAAGVSLAMAIYKLDQAMKLTQSGRN